MKTRLSWRLWLRISLFAVAVVLLIVRLIPLRHTKVSVEKSVTDLAATSPLNQPGDGVAPSEAYDVYSGLYRTPSPDPLVFGDDLGLLLQRDCH